MSVRIFLAKFETANVQLNDFESNFRVFEDEFEGLSGLGISQVKNNAALLYVHEWVTHVDTRGLCSSLAHLAGYNFNVWIVLWKPNSHSN